MTADTEVRPGTAVHRGNPVTVDRYTTAARINHWITAACLVLLALSGLALFHPSLFFLTALFGGGEFTRIVHPWIGVVMLISFAGLMALFMLNFHHIVVRALVDSYTAIPMGGFNPQSALITLTDTLVQTFSIMLRLASPFIIYGLLFNVAVGLINKLAPQMPIYFISLPFIITGGLLLLYFGVSSLLEIFANGFVPVFEGR